MSDGYVKKRSTYGDYSGSLLVTPLTGTTTLVSLRGADSLGGAYTIYVQRVHVHCSTGQAGTTWDVKDSNGNSLTGAISVESRVTSVGNLTSIPTQDPIQAEFDFGPDGVALSSLATLQFVPSATGASGVISWDAYQKLASSTGFGS